MGYILVSAHWPVAIHVLMTLTFIGAVQSGYNTSFHWTTGHWSACNYKDPGSCCDCYHVRNISCVYSSTGDVVPPFYCHKSGAAPPSQRQPCAPCEQDCVLSTWNSWSPCTDVCTPGMRYRTRDVILPPQNSGAPCGSLVEIEECQDPNLPLCIFRDLNPQYRWTTGEWSSCRKLTNTSSCGEGIRGRKVICVDNKDNREAENYCLYYLHGGKPIDQELCYIPCDCEVSSWTAWGPCSKTCYKGPTSHESNGYQVRTRSVKSDPDEGGAACPALKDTKPCDLRRIPKCPRYVWHSTDWDQCTLPDPVDTSTLCGPGLQTRDVYCTLEGDFDHMPVADVLCIQESRSSTVNESFPLKPPERRACQVGCPKDCLLGEWENWSSCTQTCGSGGVRIRTRPVIQEMTVGGESCVTEGRYEETPCNPTPCTWWHTGQWSACFVDSDKPKACGIGSQVRSVYCLNALDEVVADDNCTIYSPRPIRRRACHVPCPDTCTVSDWTGWTECTKTCGVQGGVQTRNRQIIDVRGDSSDPCLPESELKQSRVCNQIPCKTYLWQIGAWSECIRMDNATKPCGDGTGIQRRHITCEMDRGYPVSERHCDPNNKPTDRQSCAAPCPQDCKLSGWSDWSLCSKTCGTDSYKVKFKMVLRWPLYGGKKCPGNPDENGIILKRKLCNKTFYGCTIVHWETSDWGQCQVKGDCGKGIQRRNVTCIKEDGKEVNQGVCYEEGLGSAPKEEQSCHMPCSGDCRMSQWTQYSPCSQSCGTEPGLQTRSRYIINYDPTRPLSSQCPHLEDSDLTESTSCGVKECPNYTWLTGTWGSCIPHNTEEAQTPSCGEGIQIRQVFCLRDDAVYIPDHVCDVVSAMPRRQQKCRIPCPVDCVLSAWSVWSNCSQSCGNGLQHRIRKIIVESDQGGRPCPSLEEIISCNLRECADFDWKVSKWGPCQPHWGMHCGPGSQHRQVSCPAGRQYEKECAARQPKPSSKMECFRPCSGDCIMSEWSEFTQCDCDMPGATKTRHRDIQQQPLPSAVQCGPTVETELCECPAHQLVIGGWTSCQLSGSANHKLGCGKGIQRRPVNCIREDGKVVHLSKCHLGNLTLSQPCEVPCPKDCKLSGYSDWSECTDTCGVEAVMRRYLNIIHEGNDLGRRCPPEELLTQVMVCNSEPCYNYTWYRGPWQGCQSNRIGSCGVGRETRMIECHRSDGTPVSDVFCFQNELNALTSRDEMRQSEKIRLDLDTERSCGEPCPGDCVVTEWSEYGPCIFNCSHPQHPGVQTRSRAIVRPSLGGAPCPWDLIQIRSCPGSDALCPLFSWEVTHWNSRNRRKVHCVLQGGLVVNGGCIIHDQPAKHKDCVDTCGVFASCLEGRCVCEPGFVGNGTVCLPEFGCASDHHCYLNNTYCDLMNKECLCLDDSLPGPDLTCLFVGASSSNMYDPLEELNQLFIYILIGCLIALLLLGVITIGCMIRSGLKRKRRRRHKDLTIPNKLTKIDNLDTMPKNNNQTPERKSDAKKIDKNLTHSWQNRPYHHHPQYQANLTKSQDGGESTPRATTPLRDPRSSAPLSGRKLSKPENVDLDEDPFSSDGLEGDLSSYPFLSDYNGRDQPRGNTRTLDSRASRPKPQQRGAVPSQYANSLPRRMFQPKSDCAFRIPSSNSIPSRRGGDDSDGLRPDSYSQSTLSSDSDMTAIWIPQNDPNQVDARQNRFPISSELPASKENVSDLRMRNVTSTPPHIYENLSSAEEGSGLGVEPDDLSALMADKGSSPACHPAGKRRNTEPVPMRFRNGTLPNGALAPPPSSLAPPLGLTESSSAKDIKELQGPNGTQTQIPNTQDLMSYCDQLLADLQRVANS